jgi:ribosomal 50S subunit-recycling heat shock protein
MRLDKYLKVSRIIKRRTVAKELVDKGRVLINDNVAKPSSDVRIGDELIIHMGSSKIRVKITKIAEFSRKGDAALMYELLQETVL